MRRNKLKFLLLAIIGALCSGCASTQSVSNHGNKQGSSEGPVGRLVDKVILALSGSGFNARIYFEGFCGEEHTPYFQDVSLPPITIQNPTDYGTAIDKLHSLFPRNVQVDIVQAKDQIIRIRIGNPNEAILATRINSLSLSIDERYNRKLALEAIDASPEVRRSSDKLRVSQTLPLIFGGLLVNPEGDDLNKFPHLPDTIRSVTMDEALDMVAGTFDSVVVYGACTSQYTVRAYGRNV